MTAVALHERISELVGRGIDPRGISDSVLSGLNPVHFDAKNPITLFIIQVFIIISFTQGLGWCFKYIHQPKVIAEIIGGIILGPTVFGRIPHFSESIFPEPSKSYLNLVSTVGLILFLFVVGLEVDLSVIKKNGRSSAFISFAGMALPFGMGSAVALPVYNNFVEKDKVPFGHFLLFICVSMSITAFPVLCRILTATKLLDSKVGIIVLSAGVGNDVVGWVLLALTLALVSAARGETAVYILLCAVGWSVILLWPIRKGFLRLARRSGSIANGPTPGMMTLTLLLVFASSFVTSIIGVHPIFGGFIAGLAIPHEGGFAIAITERIEDLVQMLFLPIYFVLSGLSTDMSQINTGKAWGFVILLLVLAFTGKFVGCAGMARLLGYTWRESGAIGMLMSCKGLVELIVLNVGLEVGIIDQKLFSMMVFVAVFLTFITTPCTLLIYPKQYRTRANAVTESTDEETRNKAARDRFLRLSAGGAAGGREYTTRLLVVLQKLEHLGATMFITQMLEPAPARRRAPRSASKRVVPDIHIQDDTMAGDEKDIALAMDTSFNSDDVTQIGGSSLSHRSSNADAQSMTGSVASSRAPVQIDALKLVELTGRMFTVMQAGAKDQLLLTDDALQLYKQFGRLRSLNIVPHLTIVSEDSFPTAVAEYAEELGSELVVVPWIIPVVGSLTEAAAAEASPETPASPGASSSHVPTAFENIFDSDGSPMYTHFIRNLYARTTADVVVFIDRGFGGATVTPPGSGQHIFLPFFGGPDDRLAMRLVVQLCHHSNVTATVVRIEREDVVVAEEEASDSGSIAEGAREHQAAFNVNQLTIGGANRDEQSRVVSETADNIAWTYYTTVSGATAQGALSRIHFSSVKSAHPLADAAEYAEAALIEARADDNWRPLLIVTGRGRRRAAYSHERELTLLLAQNAQHPTVGAELRKTVGDASAALLLAGGQAAQASFLVCEAGQ